MCSSDLDLYVEIIVAEHEFLVREGDDLHISVRIPMTSAVLGTHLKVESLDGEVELEIKPGTQSGTVIPIRGKGMTKLRGGSRGELFAHIEVEIPKKLNREQEALIRKFADSHGDEKDRGQVRKSSDGGIFGKFKEAFKG